VYVHVPFCGRRCSYCDFAIAVRRDTPVTEYVAGISAELRLRFPDVGGGWEVETIYLGGGTPSRLGAEGVRRLLDALGQHVALAPGGEVTLEANPEDVTAARASAWRAAGVTRLSIGAQSFDAAVLSWMHREHTADRTRQAVAAARDAGISEISLDLIFALPTNLRRSWEKDLDSALELAPDHLSLYGLTVEPRTPLGRWVARGETAEAPEEAYEREYLTADEVLRANGFEHYEVSNFAKPGRRARHNQAYWSGVPYVGVGPAAHEYDGESRRWNNPGYVAWSARIAAGIDPAEGAERLTADNRIAERVYLELRTAGGTVLNDEERPLVASWISAGWARQEGGRLVLTPAGWLRLDSLAVALANARSRVYI
jgi:oxygen-independent coproporphyrinogen-3 oxidase